MGSDHYIHRRTYKVSTREDGTIDLDTEELVVDKNCVESG